MGKSLIHNPSSRRGAPNGVCFIAMGYSGGHSGEQAGPDADCRHSMVRLVLSARITEGKIHRVPEVSWKTQNLDVRPCLGLAIMLENQLRGGQPGYIKPEKAPRITGANLHSRPRTKQGCVAGYQKVPIHAGLRTGLRNIHGEDSVGPHPLVKGRRTTLAAHQHEIFGHSCFQRPISLLPSSQLQ